MLSRIRSGGFPCLQGWGIPESPAGHSLIISRHPRAVRVPSGTSLDCWEFKSSEWAGPARICFEQRWDSQTSTHTPITSHSGQRCWPLPPLLYMEDIKFHETEKIPMIGDYSLPVNFSYGACCFPNKFWNYLYLETSNTKCLLPHPFLRMTYHGLQWFDNKISTFLCSFLSSLRQES